MALTFVRLILICRILFCIIVASEGAHEAEMKKRKPKEDRMKLLKEYAEFEAHVTDTVTSIFKNLHQDDDCAEEDKDANGVCPKALPESQQDLNGSEIALLERLETIHEILLTLIPLVTMTESKSLETRKSKANVPRPIVWSRLNESVDFSCNRKDQRLSLCIWEHQRNGENQVIVVDDDGVILNGGKAGVEGTVYEAKGLAAGHCVLRIQKFGHEDIGRWSCTLIAETGVMFTGAVALDNRKHFAGVSQPVVVAAKLNTSVHFSCDSHGRTLSVCMWEKNVGGGTETIVIDREDEQEGRRISERVSFFGSGLQKGECGIKIESTNEDDLGPWRCSLLTTGSGQVFTGEVNVRLKGWVAGIYLATATAVLKVVSNKTSQPSTSAVISKLECCLDGIAIDTMRQKLYWTNKYRIYRSEMEGTEIQPVLDTTEYGHLKGLGFDFITGNIYVTSDKGNIVVCDGTLSGNFTCIPLLNNGLAIRGIALNPNEGTMYWGECCGSIKMAAMDGSNITTFASGANWAFGIVIDFDTSRLYWADNYAKKIQSCGLDNRTVVTHAQVSGGPWGIAVVDNTVYWSLADNAQRVESMDIDGGGVCRSVYNGTEHIVHLTSSEVTLPKNRKNPCARQTCSGTCVLNPTSFQCFE